MKAKPKYRFSCHNCIYETDSHSDFIEHIAKEYEVLSEPLEIEILDDLKAFNSNSPRVFYGV